MTLEEVEVKIGGPTAGMPLSPPAEEIKVALIDSVTTYRGKKIVLDVPQLSHVNAVAQAAQQEAARASA